MEFCKEITQTVTASIERAYRCSYHSLNNHDIDPVRLTKAGG